MSFLPCITREDVPCWYEISWREKSGVIVRVHQDFANGSEMPHEDSPIVSHIKSEHDADLKLRFGEDFGVNGALRYLGQSGEFLEYQAPIHLCRKLTGKCMMCLGKGKRDWPMGPECLCCSGSGDDYTYDYTEAIRTSVSLGILANMLSLPEPMTSSSQRQLLTLDTSMSKDAFYVGGELSAVMVNYLYFRMEGPIPEMIQAMVSVSQKMEGRVHNTFGLHPFRADVRSEARVHVSCPGDACGIDPHHNHSSRSGAGYRVSDHHVDQPMQQMMLVASLAALHDLARAAKF